MGRKSRSRSKKRKTKSQSSDDEPESRTDERSSESKGKKKRKDKVKKGKKEKHSKARRSASESDLTSGDSKRSRSRKSKGKVKKKAKEKDRAKDKEKSKEKQKQKAKKNGGEREEDIEKDRSRDKDKVRKKDERKDKEKEKEREKDKEKAKAKEKETEKKEKDKEKEKSKRKNARRRSSSQSSQSRRDKKQSRGRKRSRSPSESSRSSKGGLKSARKRAAGAWDAKGGGEAPANASQDIVARAATTAAPVPPPPGGFRIQSFEELLQQVRNQGTTASPIAQAGASINLALPARPLSGGVGSREADYGRRDEVFPEPSPEILSKANAHAKKEEDDGRELLRKTGQVATGPPGLPTGVLVLNQKFVDFLIGPGGQSLAAINYAAGVSIVLDQSHMWEGYTIARIYGAEENAQRAKLAIEFKTTQWIPRTGVVRKAGPTGGPVGISGWQHQANNSPAMIGTDMARPATSTSVAL